MPDSDPEVNTLCDGDPLARALAGLRPAPAGLDPTHVVFLAGRDAAARKVAFWQRVVAAQGVALIVFAGVIGLYATQPPVEPIVLQPANRPPADPPAVEPEPAPMPREAPDPSAEPYAPGRAGFVARAAEPTPEERAKWLQLRNDVLAAGIGVLPTPARPQPPTGDWGGSDLPRVYAAPVAPKPTPPKTDLPPD